MKTNKKQRAVKTMEKQFMELLNIHGVSGDEKAVREYLIKELKGKVDNIFVDKYGNLLGENKYGDGSGATVMLSAHMDTVRGVLADREVIVEGDTVYSSKGPLGADDRGGISIILDVLRKLDKLESFNGTLKLAFPREEEIGCIGSTNMDKNWYKDVDLAIVVDRRGDRDIVTGCGMAFCSDSVGAFVEDAAQLVDMDWTCVEGGISDAMTFSENGINSINLSAGYMNEHTDKEYASLTSMKETSTLILQIFAIIDNFYERFEIVPTENRWVKSWYSNKHYPSSNYFTDDEKFYYEDSLVQEDIWAETATHKGDVYVYEIGAELVIQQGENEIILKRSELRELMDQLRNV